MVPKILSRSGCWTCRIRHRKCDEAHTECHECRSRGITCHGYGPKPYWIDDPAQLLQEISLIKKAIKSNARGKTQKRLHDTLSSRGDRRTAEGNSASLHAVAQAASTIIHHAGGSEESVFREAELSMYYLDCIFPILFPYYVWNPTQGGRGWLFWLLTQNVPLRQAALSLAALHQRADVPPGTNADETELLEYHTKALSGLREALCGTAELHLIENPDQLIYVMACGCSLISFEVCQGGSNQWQAHLQALVSIACNPTFSAMYFRSPGNEASTENSAVGSRLKRISEPGRRRALEFFIAQILWYELLACVSTGAEPRVPYRMWLAMSCINMVDMMGCEHWALALIGDIASLHARRTELETELLSSKIDWCELQLQSGIARLSAPKFDDETLGNLSSIFQSAKCKLRTYYVTLAFATAAQLLLLLARPVDISSGPSPGDGMHLLLTKLTDTLEKASKIMSLRGLVWPICVAGSLADKSQQPQFRRVLELIEAEGETSFGNCDNVLRVLELCWRTDKIYSGGMRPWREAMVELGNIVLLI